MSKLLSFSRLSMIAVTLLAITGCATNAIYSSSSTQSIPLGPKVLVLPINALVYEAQVLSERELLPDESKSFSRALDDALMEYMFDKGAEYIPYGSVTIKDEHISALNQAKVIVDAAQGKSSSSSRFYALGKESIDFLSSYEADYLLIADYTKIKPSGASAVASLLIGIGNSTTYQGYDLALFDLRDGQLAWSHRQPTDDINWAAALDIKKESSIARNLTAMMKGSPI